MEFNIIFLIVSVINSLAFMFSMTNTLLFQIRCENKIFITIYLLLFQLLAAPHMGQYVSIIMLGGVLLMIASSEKHYMINIVFSLVGYLIYIFIYYIMSFFFNLFDVSFSKLYQLNYLSIIFIIVFAILTYTATYYVGKFIKIKLKNIITLSAKVQLLFFIQIMCCAIIFAFHVIISDSKDYSSHLLFLNLTLFCVLIVTIVIMFLCIYFIQKDEEIYCLQKEKQSLEDNTKKTEQFYQYSRETKQNYIGILSMAQHYVEEGDINNLKDLLDKQVFSESHNLTDTEDFMDKLDHIKLLELKSVLYSKVLTAMNENLQIVLDIQNEITDVSMDLLDLSKIVEALMNNAIEAARESEMKKIKLLLMMDDISFTILISNSSLDMGYGLDEIYNKGVTSKNEGEGMGLYNVSQILNKYNNVIHSTNYNNLIFTQTIEICNTAMTQFD